MPRSRGPVGPSSKRPARSPRRRARGLSLESSRTRDLEALASTWAKLDRPRGQARQRDRLAELVSPEPCPHRACEGAAGRSTDSTSFATVVFDVPCARRTIARIVEWSGSSRRERTTTPSILIWRIGRRWRYSKDPKPALNPSRTSAHPASASRSRVAPARSTSTRTDPSPISNPSEPSSTPAFATRETRPSRPRSSPRRLAGEVHLKACAARAV